MYLIEKFEKWAGLAPTIAEDIGLPFAFWLSLLSPGFKDKELYSLNVSHYHAFQGEFRIRHPIMYWLFYKWWLEYRVRKYKKGKVPSCGDEWPVYDPTGVYVAPYMVNSTRFALYHPILFLFWLIFRRCCILLEQLLTLPIKINRKEN